MIRALIIYHLLSASLCSLTAVHLYRYKSTRAVQRAVLLGVLLLMGMVLSALLWPVEGFAKIQLLAWGVFLYFPLFVSVGIWILWSEHRRFALGLAFLLLVTLLITVDAFLVEPHWLQVTRVDLTSSKLEESLTVVVLADIQTDSPGKYEQRVLSIAAAERPDLILLAGDYIQVWDPDQYQQESTELNRIFHEANLTPPLGIYAVRGNTEWNNWKDIFQGLEVMTFEESETLDLGPALLTGLSWQDSVNPSFKVTGGDKYHIVLGHSPNFSLGEIDGDLLLAGHTHVGQVQLPGIGPLLTLSVVPRSWASGLTEIQSGKYLLVSRGIGLERGLAPRMRFFCRPEVIVLRLHPAP